MLNLFCSQPLVEFVAFLRTELLCATGKSQFFKVHKLQGLASINGNFYDNRRSSNVKATQVQIVGDETSPDLWKRAAQLKSQYRRISLADCFGVALAGVLNAPFWTSDRHELTALADASVAKIHFIR